MNRLRLTISGGLPPPSPQLRLSPAVRLYLCAALDSGDWTRLAAGLRISRHIVAWLEVRTILRLDSDPELDYCLEFDNVKESKLLTS